MSNRYIILSFFLSLGLNSCDNRTQKKFFDKIVYDTYHSNYEGIITDKYIDKYNHARPVVVIEEQIFGKKQMDFMFESSDLFDFFKVGDTIIKKNKSLTINIKRKNIDTIIKFNFSNVKGNENFYSENQYLTQD